MDTRTPRRPGQGGTAGIDSGPALNTVKVPSDPAKLSSTQASFRVRLVTPVDPLIDAPAGAAFGDPYGMQSGGNPYSNPYRAAGLGTRPMVTPQVVLPNTEVPALVGIGATPRRKARVTAVTWSGQAAPGDLAATRLLEAVRLSTVPAPAGAPAGDDTQQLPHVPSYGHAVPRQPGSPGSGGPSAAPASTTAGQPAWSPHGELPAVSAAGAAEARHLREPGRRVDLGLVLLPLRVVLGSLSGYAGFSKLCDPVYFDGGDRGSMMRWLSALHPWKAAAPLLDFAMAHPVGSGLAVAFTEIVVGVLTILGLWQRLAAGAAMLLSAALLFTVSWRAVPVYDTPDLIFLAAWSPLLIAGAPFGSLDGRIALNAWRRYGSEAPAALRRRVLRRGAVVTAVVVGLTLLIGSMLGAAVRTGREQQAPVSPPTDFGSPMWPGNSAPATPSPSHSPTPTPSPSRPAGSPSPASPSPGKSSGKPKSSSSPSGNARPSGGGAGGAGQGGSGSGGSSPRSSNPSTPGLIGGVLGSGPVELPKLGLERQTEQKMV
ncbi:DoxX family membrane protein [Kitasatospora sp. NPDC048540]|uniref:DoxX family membrane protein n=2 Tax=unclassified Kitasatospora TaxID=2633591 RepID=UPI00340E0460